MAAGRGQVVVRQRTCNAHMVNMFSTMLRSGNPCLRHGLACVVCVTLSGLDSQHANRVASDGRPVPRNVLPTGAPGTISRIFVVTGDICRIGLQSLPQYDRHRPVRQVTA